MESENKHKEHEKIIHVNKTQIRVIEDQLTGRQILEKAGMNQTECELFLAHGHDPQPIGPDQIVEIKNGLRFHAICKVVPLG
jgi:hypothetical protein